mgnify:FL=1
MLFLVQMEKTAIYRIQIETKSAVNIKFTALLAFFVFCSQAVPSYSKVRKKTKFRIFLNSLQQANLFQAVKPFGVLCRYVQYFLCIHIEYLAYSHRYIGNV